MTVHQNSPPSAESPQTPTGKVLAVRVIITVLSTWALFESILAGLTVMGGDASDLDGLVWSGSALASTVAVTLVGLPLGLAVAYKASDGPAARAAALLCTLVPMFWASALVADPMAANPVFSLPSLWVLHFAPFAGALFVAVPYLGLIAFVRFSAEFPTPLHQVARESDLPRLQRWSLRPHLVWLGPPLALVLLLTGGALEWMGVPMLWGLVYGAALAFMLFFVLWALWAGMANLSSGMALVSDEQRPRVALVARGVRIAAAAAFIGLSIGVVGALSEQLLKPPEWIMAPLGVVFFVPLFCAPVIGIVSLALGTLLDGALDSRLAINKAALYGVLGGVVLFLFGGIEVFLSDYLLAAIGAPEGASTWLAGGTVAIAFGPLRSAFKVRIDRWLDAMLPPTLLAEGPRAEAVIAFADIVGYSALAAENEDDALTMLNVFHRQARRAAEQHKGKLVKTLGDGALMEFKTGDTAILAAQHVGQSFGEACKPLGLPEGVLRIGIHRGLVARRKDGDVFGDAVNVASRLQEIAEPGQVVVSAAVRDRLDEADSLEELGERHLKNVPEPVECFGLSVDRPG